MTQNRILQENEINLFKIWNTLVKHKIIIFIFTLSTTIIATGYAWTKTPIYSGSILIELGEVVNNYKVAEEYQPTEILNLDNLNNLKEVISRATEVNVYMPSGTTNILKLSVESSNPSEIKPKLENSAQFIINRHQEKAKVYQNDNSRIRMTQVVGDIKVEKNPIKPNKQLIITIGFISGLMLGIFLAFFLEFIGARRNR